MAPGMFFYAPDCDDQHPILSSKSPCRESCFMCDKPLGRSADIFMYRGNTPFCSTDCRQEQIEMDDAEERRRRKRSAHRTKSESAAGNSKSVRTDTIQVA
uniref:FLZ-type domain-containing protein n=1 Tax=Kalanchoe fedtschenkoi TaxID=63787 RepID=A0A7N0THZ0_KALFE